MAAVIIYEDGTLENIPITDIELHMVCYRKHREKSKIFKEKTQDIDFSDYNQFVFLNTLTNRGSIVMYNENLAEMVGFKDRFKDDFVPTFIVCLPEYFQSEEQKVNFYEIITNYDGDFLRFNRFNSLTGRLSNKTALEYVQTNSKRGR